MLPLGSKARTAAGLLAVFASVNVVYFVARTIYEPLAFPTSIGLATTMIVLIMRRWHREPPQYDQELRKLTSMVNLMPLMHETFLPFGQWAMEPEGLVTLLSHIQFHQPRVIVECGSGLSTLLIGNLIKQNRSGHLYSVEEDENWHRTMSNLIDDQGLGEWITLVHAPLKPYPVSDGHEVKWYCTEVLKQALSTVDRIGLLIVDGPKTVDHLSRFPALPYFASMVNDKTLLVLDDANRPQEACVIDEWQKRYSLSVKMHGGPKRQQAYIRVDS
ncbi:MAG: hypothetical protein GX620_13425 [Chloroflexi bacterium]|nr:hypothetical protein [Chloroflexota bacterium]